MYSKPRSEKFHRLEKFTYSIDERELDILSQDIFAHYRTMVKQKRKNKWKPVEINLKERAPELICFEELADYEAIRGRNTYNDPDDLVHPEGDKNVSSSSLRKRKNLVTLDEQSKNKKKMKKKKMVTRFEETNIEDSDHETSEPELDNPLDMSAWNEFGLSEPIVRALKAKNFTSPTEIQKLTLPKAIIERKDILGAAETGSGKTLAFALPIVNSILEHSSSKEAMDSLWALILTPTRELAIQVRNHIRNLCAFTDIKVQEVVGGLSVEKQNRKLNEKPQIVVGTPGRLWELIRLGNHHLSKINSLRYFVIDEADRMFEKGHFAELDNILENMNLAEKIEKRQVFVFSATLTLTHEPPSYVFNAKKGKKKGSSKLSPDQKLSAFIKSLNLNDPAIIDITKKNVLASGISENLVQCTLEEKDYYLFYIVRVQSGKKMVFCNSINCVKRLHRLLNILQCNAKILFADMDQKQRLKNLEHFEKHPNALLVTTDVAARGLDIANIDHIIHYQVPKTAELYVHRSGRSVREKSAVGNSIILCSPGEDFSLNKIMKTLSRDAKLPPYELSAPEVFVRAKEAVNLSRRIERIETKVQNVQSNARSIEKWAKDMDILLDDDEMPEKLDDHTRKSVQLEVKKLRAELKYLLSKPMLPLTESLRYPQFEAVQTFLENRPSNKHN